jgi:hypothetical protein
MKSSIVVLMVLSMAAGAGNVRALGPVASQLFAGTSEAPAAPMPARAAVYYPQEKSGPGVMKASAETRSLMDSIRDTQRACGKGRGYEIGCVNQRIAVVVSRLPFYAASRGAVYAGKIKACNAAGGAYDKECVDSIVREILGKLSSL